MSPEQLIENIYILRFNSGIKLTEAFTFLTKREQRIVINTIKHRLRNSRRNYKRTKRHRMALIYNEWLNTLGELAPKLSMRYKYIELQGTVNGPLANEVKSDK